MAPMATLTMSTFIDPDLIRMDSRHWWPYLMTWGHRSVMIRRRREKIPKQVPPFASNQHCAFDWFSFSRDWCSSLMLFKSHPSVSSQLSSKCWCMGCLSQHVGETFPHSSYFFMTVNETSLEDKNHHLYLYSCYLTDNPLFFRTPHPNHITNSDNYISFHFT